MLSEAAAAVGSRRSGWARRSSSTFRLSGICWPVRAFSIMTVSPASQTGAYSWRYRSVDATDDQVASARTCRRTAALRTAVAPPRLCPSNPKREAGEKTASPARPAARRSRTASRSSFSRLKVFRANRSSSEKVSRSGPTPEPVKLKTTTGQPVRPASSSPSQGKNPQSLKPLKPWQTTMAASSTAPSGCQRSPRTGSSGRTSNSNGVRSTSGLTPGPRVTLRRRTLPRPGPRDRRLPPRAGRRLPPPPRRRAARGPASTGPPASRTGGSPPGPG